jgi:hypothetical protein
MNPFLEDVDSFAIPIADEPLVQKDTPNTSTLDEPVKETIVTVANADEGS